MLKKMYRNRFKFFSAVGCSTLCLPMTAYASEVGSSGMSGVLDGVTELLAWFTKSMTSICSWLIGNELGAIYLGIFIIGAAVAMLFRVLHSA